MGGCPACVMAADMSRLASADADMATCPAPRGQCIPAVGGAGIAVAMRGAREKLGCPCCEAHHLFFCPRQEGEADHSGYAGELGFRVSIKPQFYFLCFRRAIWGPPQGLGLWFLCTHISGTFSVTWSFTSTFSWNPPNSSRRQAPIFLLWKISNLPKS